MASMSPPCVDMSRTPRVARKRCTGTATETMVSPRGFTRTPEGTKLQDAGSLNGTYVNKELVDQTLLRHGDEVQIGKFRLVYFASPQGFDR